MTALRTRQTGSIRRRMFWLQLVLFMVILGLLLMLQSVLMYRYVKEQYGERSLLVSGMIASDPRVVSALQNQTSGLQKLALDWQKNLQADYVVITNQNGIRLTHPNPENIGKHMVGGDYIEPLELGRSIIETTTGTLGVSIRAKVPIFSEDHQILGLASVGFLLPKIQLVSLKVGQSLLLGAGVAVLLALLGAHWISHRIKRLMFQLEPEQISLLLTQHRTVLEAMEEGVLVLQNGRVVLWNSQAQQHLPGVQAGLPLLAAWPEADRWADQQVAHLPLSLNGTPMLVNVQPMAENSAVLTFQNRAEFMRMIEKLTRVEEYSGLLRAQTHEFNNRLHTISGLLQLGHHQEALQVIQQETRLNQQHLSRISQISVPKVAALLLGKGERARELGLGFEVHPDSLLPEHWAEQADLIVTVLGNLINNSFEALSNQERGSVGVLIGEDPDGLQIEVTDNGPGIPAEHHAWIFEQGASTRGKERGIGLFEVKRQVEALGGNITHFQREGHTVFQMNLPHLQEKA
ncbi:ATP-binding protein [Deinococcus cellulosilyticus]|nr:sensor histidine kinase [Deinococcus cellulosilyticus]